MLQILNLLLSLMIYRLGNSLQRKRRRSTKYSVSTVSFLIESLKIDITFITSVSSKATDLYRLLLNLRNKTSLPRLHKLNKLSNLRTHYYSEDTNKSC